METQPRSFTRTLKFLALLIAAVLLAACGDGEDEVAAEDGGEDEPIIIGNAGSQTGWMEAFDAPPFEGAQIAVDEINENGGVLGRPLEMIAIDGRTDETTLYNAGIELVDQGAVAIMAGCDFDFGAPTAIAAQERGVVSMASCASSPRFGLEGVGELAFSLGTTTNRTGATMAEYAYEEGYRTVWVLEDTSIVYSQDQASYFLDRWTELAGAEAVLGHETFLNDDESISAQVQRYRRLNQEPDFIWLASYLPGGGTALRQLRAAGIDVPILAGDGFQQQELLVSTAGSQVSQFFASSYAYTYLPGGVEAEVDRLVEEYIDRYEREPEGAYFLTGYGVIEAFASAITECECTDGEGIAEALTSGEERTVAGVIDATFTPESHHATNRSSVIFELDAGEFRYIDRWLPEVVPPAVVDTP